MGRHRKLTAEQENEIYNRYLAGERVSTIANAMQLPYPLVYTSIKREKDYVKLLNTKEEVAPQEQ